MRVLAALNGLELFGHERGNIEVFKALREMGAIVRVGVSNQENGGDVAIELKGLGFETFPVSFGAQWSLMWLKEEGLKFAMVQFKRVFKSSWEFHRQIQEFQPTHIHLGSPLAYSFISLALLRWKLPLIWRMGDCPPAESRFNMPIWSAGMHRASRIVAISNYVCAEAVENGVPRDKISLVYNLAPSASDGEWVPPPVLGPEEYAMIYVGAVSAHKGLIPLVEAYALVCLGHPGLQLWILGESRWDKEFRELLDNRIAELGIVDKVLFAGQIHDPAPWYAAASIHVAPSLCEEALGNVVMEAKRAGSPSIAFPSGGLPEMIRHQIDGYVCEAKTSESLAGAINWMLADRGRLARMRVAAREDCEARFGCGRFMEQWAKVYLDILLPHAP